MLCFLTNAQTFWLLYTKSSIYFVFVNVRWGASFKHGIVVQIAGMAMGRESRDPRHPQNLFSFSPPKVKRVIRVVVVAVAGGASPSDHCQLLPMGFSDPLAVFVLLCAWFAIRESFPSSELSLYYSFFLFVNLFLISYILASLWTHLSILV